MNTLNILNPLPNKPSTVRGAGTRQAKSYKLQASYGYITLISILVVGAVGVAISVSLLLLGLGSSRTGLAYQQSNQAKALANACAEEGLEQIRLLSSYTGSGGLSLGQGTCTYVVTNPGPGPQNLNINTIGTVGNTIRKVSVIINAINPVINIIYWQEVP